MDRSSKQKINKETQALNDTLGLMDLTDIFRKFHPQTAEYTFFSSEHGTFCWIDHILGHKLSLSKLKKSEIIPSIFTDHNTIRLEINKEKKKKKKKDLQKNTNMWRQNNMLLNNQWITEEKF